MAATPFIDLATIDLTQTVATREQIYERLPHRFEFMQLDEIVYLDKEAGVAVARRDVKEDEFWVPGHIPGRPLLPGVLMIETAAQMASYLAYEFRDFKGFLGFGGVDGVKFRGSVTPPATMYFILKLVEVRSRRVVADVQACLDNKLVFEARVTGMVV